MADGRNGRLAEGRIGRLIAMDIRAGRTLCTKPLLHWDFHEKLTFQGKNA
jgi:hypothetical protein